MTKDKLDLSEIIKELEAIKKLLALQLLRNGASQVEVALALDVHRTTVGRIFPKDVIGNTD